MGLLLEHRRERGVAAQRVEGRQQTRRIVDALSRRPIAQRQERPSSRLLAALCVPDPRQRIGSRSEPERESIDKERCRTRGERRIQRSVEVLGPDQSYNFV